MTMPRRPMSEEKNTNTDGTPSSIDSLLNSLKAKADKAAMPNPSETVDAAQVIAMLYDTMMASESDTARIQAAKVLLERIAPIEDDDARRREAEERAAAIADARCLLAELAVAKSAGLFEPPPLDQGSAPAADNAAG